LNSNLRATRQASAAFIALKATRQVPSKVQVLGFNVCLGTFVTPQQAALEVARQAARFQQAAAGC
jgi:hypothetical protein